MEIGKILRMRRFFKNNKTIIVPLDHALYSGPVRGIEEPVKLVKMIAETEVDGILITPGLLIKVRDVIGDLSIVLRLDGTHTRLGSHLERTELITSVEEALKLGADMVVINVFIGVENEDRHLQKLGMIATLCFQWGMPLMAEMIPVSILKSHYGKKDVSSKKEDISEDIKLVSRLGAEIGADIIKTHYSGSITGFKEAVDTATIPIVVAGGPKMANDEEFLRSVKESVTAGAAGICMGRNIWGHESPKRMLTVLCAIVHNNASVEEALNLFNE